MAQRVIVVGAGVVGLSCAVRLAEAGYDTSVLARDLPLETTSAVAGALWLPYRAHPVDRVTSWARTTFAELRRLHEGEDAGVLMRDGVLLHRAVPARPTWADGVADVVPLGHVRDPAPGYPHGLSLRVPLVDMARYLPSLVRRLAAAGGTLTRMPLQALPERGVVVNATGVAARALAPDPEVHAVRGQVVIAENPGLTRWLADEHEDEAGDLCYLLPRTDTVVIGGTAREHDWNTTPDPAVARRLLARAVRLEPRLQATRVLGHRVGLRPARSAVRLEAEHRPDGVVVHCYGHGGSGVTLSWGCADDVLRLVRGL